MDLSKTYSYLRSHFLFTSLADQDVEQVAQLFQSLTLKEGEVLYRAGYPGRNFFLVVKGAIRFSTDQGNQSLTTWKDHFGEEALLKEQVRRETARAVEPTTLLAINKNRFQALVSAYPEIKKKILAVNDSNQLAALNPFPWIGNGETIHFIDRKHVTTFLARLVLPFLLALALSGVVYFLEIKQLFAFPLIFLVFSLWVIWLWIDWGNDYYLVTSERVAWVEKVVWLHDQRKELPLQSILSANLSTNQFQRLLDFGDVVVRTYTGDLTMRNAAHPQILLDLIREAQEYAQERYKKVDADRIQQTIRDRLQLEETETRAEAGNEAALPSPLPVEPQTTESLSPLQRFLNLFRARYEFNGVITYRKHKFVLLKNGWWSMLLLMALTTAFFARLVNAISFLSLSWIVGLLGLDLLILLYIFTDWANDRFQITEKHIIDLDRKPLGRETKRSALLENVLSLDYQRKNIMQRLFDFGTVAINVGDIQLDFENVAQPRRVQQEIFEHYNQAVKRRELADAQRRREDMVEFLAAYHEENSPSPPGEVDGQDENQT